jgi:FtsP/CotA-like multicopper oxidase with cupredoxin domain
MASVDRRRFLRDVAGATVALGPVGSLLGMSGCRDRAMPAPARTDGGDERYRRALERAMAAGRARDFRLVAEAGDVEVAPGSVYETWLYGGQLPGPEIRVREGERVRVVLENRLPEATTVHWHGVPVPNAMDGVPDVTQAAVAPGDAFVYDFVAAPAGSYLYHSHAGLQLDRGLVGALVIEERTPHVEYDRDYTLVLDDWLPSAPEPASARAMAGAQDMRGMMQRMMGPQGMMIHDPARPQYAALLVNGRTPDDPPALDVRRGERVRLRFLNLASATSFRVAIAGHPMVVTHADGRPVEPVTVDALRIGMGERYDVVVEASNPGVWTLAAASELGMPEPARAILRYVGSRAVLPGRGELPEALERGRVLELADLRSLEIGEDAPLPADRTFELMVAWGMMMAPADWTIGGQRYPDADALDIREGERVHVRVRNMSPIDHPMHLHGHFFRVGRALKDTVAVPAHMGTATLEFTAENPGDWLFHCHNLYHMEAGMARVLRYV